jgi:hypothetical protein
MIETWFSLKQMVEELILTDICYNLLSNGTVGVLFRLRCQPSQMKYRDSGGKNRTGQLIRRGMRKNGVFLFFFS